MGRLAGHPRHRGRPQGPLRHGRKGQERRCARHLLRAHTRGVLYLLDVYAKKAKEDLTDAEKRDLRRFLEAVEAEG